MDAVDLEMLKFIREEKGWTQKEVSEILGYKYDGYSKIEKGERNISAENLKKLADFYNVDINIFYTNQFALKANNNKVVV